MLSVSYLKKFLPNSKSKRLFPMFSYRSFIVLGFTFRFLVIHFELFFQYDVRYDQGSYFYIECTVVSAPFVKKTVLSPLICFDTFIKNQLTYMYASISGLYILFHWSVCLSFFYVLILLLY